jgi:hypothetical protein
VKVEVAIDTTELSMLRLGGSLLSSSSQLSLTHFQSASQPSGCDRNAEIGR